ncbi:ABC transporter ATP-binding protein [Cohnella cholangitidis]|uniref:ABC transporter ATP-binding protein n=1 Tax=Cohnella cholangitidis TaxID=2598458 RepID=A0A7G5C4L2_9BACL|nr:ABC transporter ATP-binding protein [Cohnella cholangitidis]QMV44146.1 ABC transporter ATP-binding protein [Cohnella cholangitidis]
MSEQRGNQGGAGQGTAPGGPGRGPGGPGMGGMGGMGGMMPVQKAKNFKGTLRRLMGYLRPQRFKLLAVLITAILSTAFAIYSPKVLGEATTKLFEGMMGKLNGDPNAHFDLAGIWQIVVFLAGLYVVSSIFSYIQQFLMAGVAQKTVFGLRNEVNAKLGKLPLKYFDSRAHGEILSRAVNDVDNISNTLQQSLTQLITSLITIIGVIIMMLTISPWLTLILLLTLPLSMIVIRGAASRSQQHFKSQQMELGKLNGHVEEMFSGHKIVKAFGQEEKSVAKFDEINERLYESGRKAQFVSGNIMPLMSMVSNIGYVFISVVGGIMVARGSISIGNIQAFIQYARQFSMPLVQTANIANIIQSTIASAERVFELLDEEEEVPEAADGKDVKLTAPKGEVAMHGVNFGYSPDAMLIENMDIDVRSGQMVAIVGPTGAGKTTLVNLLMRFYEVNDGSITVDGADITKMKRGNLRSLFGMVLQDTWLFNGTIRDNIAYGREGATDEEIVEAAVAAHADHFIRTLPEGYDTVLNEEASNLSQGQKQLLTIARAILADPAILILDEATSSVDTRTEVYIQKAMHQLMQGRTSFVIAHRLSTIRDADLILVMNHGSIIEQGTHNELLAKGGFYADLYNSQFVGGNLQQSAG